jgi:hypothetical protein
MRGYNFTVWALRGELTSARESTAQTRVADLG